MDHQFDESYPFVYTGHVCKSEENTFTKKTNEGIELQCI